MSEQDIHLVARKGLRVTECDHATNGTCEELSAASLALTTAGAPQAQDGRPLTLAERVGVLAAERDSLRAECDRLRGEKSEAVASLREVSNRLLDIGEKAQGRVEQAESAAAALREEVAGLREAVDRLLDESARTKRETEESALGLHYRFRVLAVERNAERTARQQAESALATATRELAEERRRREETQIALQSERQTMAALVASLRQAGDRSSLCPCCGRMPGMGHPEGCLWPTVAPLLVAPSAPEEK